MKVKGMNKLKELMRNYKPTQVEICDGVSVKTYLPYQMKVDLASEVIRNVLRVDDDTKLFYVAPNEDLYLTMWIVKCYADIDTTNLSVEEVTEIYDYLKGSGLYKEIVEAAEEDINLLMQLYCQMKGSILQINAHSMSTGHMLGKMMEMAESVDFTTALTNAKLQSENMVDQLQGIAAGHGTGTKPQMNFAKK